MREPYRVPVLHQPSDLAGLVEQIDLQDAVGFCAEAGAAARVAARIAAAAKPRRSPAVYLSSQTSSKREPL